MTTEERYLHLAANEDGLTHRSCSLFFFTRVDVDLFFNRITMMMLWTRWSEDEKTDNKVVLGGKDTTVLFIHERTSVFDNERKKR